MATVWKEDSTEYFVIGTGRDYQGITDWEVSAVDLATGTVENETANITIAEIEHTIDTPVTGAVVAETAAAAKTLTLGTGEGASFTKGMAIDIGGLEFNTVKSVSGDTIALFKPLTQVIPAATSVDLTGLTGDYRVVVDMTATTTVFAAGGDYQFQVKAPSADIDITSEIFDVNDYDVNNDLGSDIDSIKKSLDNLSGGASTAKVHM